MMPNKPVTLVKVLIKNNEMKQMEKKHHAQIWLDGSMGMLSAVTPPNDYMKGQKCHICIMFPTEFWFVYWHY